MVNKPVNTHRSKRSIHYEEIKTCTYSEPSTDGEEEVEEVETKQLIFRN